MENFTWTSGACYLWLPKIRLRYLLLRRILTFDKSLTLQSYKDWMPRSNGTMSNLQHGVCKRWICLAWMSKGQVHEKIKNALIRSSGIFSWTLDEIKKIKGGTRILCTLRMRWKIQRKQLIQSRIRNDNSQHLKALISSVFEM